MRILFILPRKKHIIDEDWIDAISRNIRIDVFRYRHFYELMKAKIESYDYVIVQPSFLRFALFRNLKNLIILDHGVLGMNFRTDIYRSFKSYLMHLFSRKVVLNAKLIALSNYQRLIFLSHFKKDAFVVPNPIRDMYSSDFPKEETINAIFTGKAHQLKGFHIFIHALRLIKNKVPRNFKVKVFMRLKDGKVFDEFDFVEYNGFVGRKQFLNELKNAHFLIYPSLSETFGLPVAEAMALRRPVITTRCGGVEDFFSEKFGIYADKNPLSLARAILKMIEDFTKYDMKLARKTIYDYAGYKPFWEKFSKLIE